MPETSTLEALSDTATASDMVLIVSPDGNITNVLEAPDAAAAA